MESKVLEAYAYSSPLGTPTVSIDLGTSRSAMAVTFVGNELYSQELILPSRCGSRPSDQGKIQTAILLQPRFERFRASTVITSPNDVEVVAFGDEAERQYADMPAEERNGYIFCKWFKMMLHQTNVNPDPIIEADPNARFTVTLSVAIAKSIEVFRDAAMQHLRRTHKADVKESDIIWVLTVPAIWSEKSKFVMRTAAFAAGLTTSLHSENLILCLEPEGICFTALTQASSQSGSTTNGDTHTAYGKLHRGSDRDLETVLSRRGNKFVVLDAGGGTVDIAAYEVVSERPFRVKQLAAPTGGPYGSTQVDDMFMNFIRDLIGPAASTLLDSHQDLILDIRRAWEAVKIDAARDGKPSQINLSSLQMNVLLPLGLPLGDCVADYKAIRPTCLAPEVRGETRLILPATLMSSFFDPSIQKIIFCLHGYRTSTRAGEASHLILAGGYSSSPYLWSVLRTEFGASIRILGVARPDTAVVRGAAIYGTAHKERVTHRISAFTYGIALLGEKYNGDNYEHLQRFNETAVDDDGVRRLRRFEEFVLQGTEIPPGYKSDKLAIGPLLRNQDTMGINLLRSKLKHPRYPDEDGVKKLAYFSTPVDMTVPFASRLSDVQFEFGDTELKCKTLDVETGAVIRSADVEYSHG